MRRLSARSLRSRSDDAPVNPMDSISNLADAMLVLAVGIMLALIINLGRTDGRHACRPGHLLRAGRPDRVAEQRRDDRGRPDRDGQGLL